jgi:hypothetical protein
MGTNIRHLKHSFNAGEWSPLLDSRFDLAKYNSSCETLDNAIVLPYGSVTRRPGTKFVATTKNNGPARLIRFTRSLSTSYILEFGINYIRFFINGAPVYSGASVYEIATVYGESDLENLSYIQSVDVMYLMDGTHPVQKLTHYNDTDWTIEEVNWRHPAYKEPNGHIHKTLTATFAIASQTAWATATDYKVGDMIKNAAGTKAFTCIQAHTSGDTIPEPTGTTAYWYLYYEDASPDTWTPHIERGAIVSLAASQDDIFTADMVGSRIQLTHPQTQTLVYTKHTATFTSAAVPYRIFGPWTFTTTGTWKATLVIERSIDYGNTWTEYKKFDTIASDTAANFILTDTESVEDVFYRYQITAFTSGGTVAIEWTRANADWTGEVEITSLNASATIPDASEISERVCHYKLDNNTATAAVTDSSGNTHTAALYRDGGAWAVYYTENVFDTDIYKVTEGSASFHFDPSVETGVVLPSSVPTALYFSLIKRHLPRSVAFWFRMDALPSAGNEMKLFSCETAGGTIRLAAAVNENGKLILTTNGIETTGTTVLAVDTWYHLVVTSQADAGLENKLYLNGALEISYDKDITYATANYWTIGAERPNSTSFVDAFDGYIDDFAIWAKILTPSNIMTLLGGTSAVGKVITPIYDDQTAPNGITAATMDWALPAWTSGEGYPEHAAFLDQRLVLMRGINIWMSKVDDYENFEVGTEDDDAISLKLLSRTPDPIQWAIGMQKLLIGTENGEWTVGGSSSDDAITPTNILARQQSAYGSGKLEAIRVNDLVMFIQRQGKKVRELLYQFETDKWISNDLTILSEHLAAAGVLDAAFQQQKHAVLWCILNDGTIASMTYEKEHEVVGWCSHDLSGTGESVAVAPQSESDDQIWLIVNRTIDGSAQRHIEYLSNLEYSLSDIDDANFVDAGIVTEAAAATTISGLDHLEGKEVAVLADGVVLNDGFQSDANFVVTGGSITIAAEAATYAVIHVGLPYKTTVQPSRIELINTNGSRSRIKRIPKATLLFYKTAGAKYGIDIDHLDVSELDETELYTGDTDINIPDDYGKKATLIIQQDKPLPMTLLGIEYEVQIND